MLHAKVEVFNGAVWGRSTRPAVAVRPQTNAQAQETFLKGALGVPWHDEKRNPFDWVISLAVHLLIVALLVIVPLWLTDTIDLRGFQSITLVAPRPPAAAPPAAVTQKIAKIAPHVIQPGRLTAPVAIPAKIQIVHDEAPPMDAIGIAGGITGGQSDGVLGGILGGVGDAASRPAPPPPAVKKILRVGGEVKQPLPISTPQPAYPAIARSARQEGVVVIDAIIDEQGNVVQEQLVQGPPLLVRAALDAVTRWKYEPTYLNGEPVSIRTHIEVHFNLR